MYRIAAAAASILLGLLVALIPSSASPHTSPSCETPWGSLRENAPSTTDGHLVDVRAGRHACFDRLVLDVAGGEPGYFVQYVDQVRTHGAGIVVPLRGGARLEIVSARADDGEGHLTYPIGSSELVDVNGFSTFRQVAGAGSFEGQSTIGLGVRARLPFRVFTLAGPGDHSRLVIDVAHHW